MELVRRSNRDYTKNLNNDRIKKQVYLIKKLCNEVNAKDNIYVRNYLNDVYYHHIIKICKCEFCIYNKLINNVYKIQKIYSVMLENFEDLLLYKAYNNHNIFKNLSSMEYTIVVAYHKTFKFTTDYHDNIRELTNNNYKNELVEYFKKCFNIFLKYRKKYENYRYNKWGKYLPGMDENIINIIDTYLSPKIT